MRNLSLPSLCSHGAMPSSSVFDSFMQRPFMVSFMTLTPVPVILTKIYQGLTFIFAKFVKKRMNEHLHVLF